MPVNFNGVNNSQVNSQRPAPTERANDAAASAKAETTPGPATSARDSVSLSARAEAMKQAEQQLRDQPEVDDARVAEIRQALADGTYKVDAEKLAQKMLEMDKGIFG